MDAFFEHPTSMRCSANGTEDIVEWKASLTPGSHIFVIDRLGGSVPLRWIKHTACKIDIKLNVR